MPSETNEIFFFLFPWGKIYTHEVRDRWSGWRVGLQITGLDTIILMNEPKFSQQTTELAPLISGFNAGNNSCDSWKEQ